MVSPLIRAPSWRTIIASTTTTFAVAGSGSTVDPPASSVPRITARSGRRASTFIASGA
ncbi:MAG TPA: hypothetical protein VFK02_25990 [Kofleriaceae bacterium]|nr:hypothetical protein [Kofleriaceae bacterium]